MSMTPEERNFLSVAIENITLGDPLPVGLYLFMEYRFVLFRNKGDIIDRSMYERFLLKKIKHFFIQDIDKNAFFSWNDQKQAELKAAVVAPEFEKLEESRSEASRVVYDLFTEPHPEPHVAKAIMASKMLANDIMKLGFAEQSLSQLQKFSQSQAGHSVNVSVLSVYLAMQMGYSHAVILGHIAAGGLLHDIGKIKIEWLDGETPEAHEERLLQHPLTGLEILDQLPDVPQEVKLVVAQHHESHDGTGYPKKLKGTAIYDLARIVALANEFDEAVYNSKGTLKERQMAAIVHLDKKSYKKFDPQKLDKALRILKMGV